MESKGATTSTAASRAARTTHSSGGVPEGADGSDGHPNAVPMQVDSQEDTDECGAENIPPMKRQKKSTSKVWNHFKKEGVTKKENGIEMQELWATCLKCTGPRPYRSRAESNKGTTTFKNYLRLKHNVETRQQTLNLVKGEDNTTTVQTHRPWNANVCGDVCKVFGEMPWPPDFA